VRKLHKPQKRGNFQTGKRAANLSRIGLQFMSITFSSLLPMPVVSCQAIFSGTITQSIEFELPSRRDRKVVKFRQLLGLKNVFSNKMIGRVK
jgi:hypothetical protein